MSIEGIAGSQMMNVGNMINKELNPQSKEGENIKTVQVSSEVGASGEKRVNKDELIHAVNTANESLKMYNRELKYSVHKKTNTIMVKLVDTENDEVIREIPSEKLLDMVAKMWEMAGLFVNESV